MTGGLSFTYAVFAAAGVSVPGQTAEGESRFNVADEIVFLAKASAPNGGEQDDCEQLTGNVTDEYAEGVKSLNVSLAVSAKNP